MIFNEITITKWVLNFLIVISFLASGVCLLKEYFEYIRVLLFVRNIVEAFTITFELIIRSQSSVIFVIINSFGEKHCIGLNFVIVILMKNVTWLLLQVLLLRLNYKNVRRWEKYLILIWLLKSLIYCVTSPMHRMKWFYQLFFLRMIRKIISLLDKKVKN